MAVEKQPSAVPSPAPGGGRVDAISDVVKPVSIAVDEGYVYFGSPGAVSRMKK